MRLCNVHSVGRWSLNARSKKKCFVSFISTHAIRETPSYLNLFLINSGHQTIPKIAGYMMLNIRQNHWSRCWAWLWSGTFCFELVSRLPKYLWRIYIGNTFPCSLKSQGILRCGWCNIFKRNLNPRYND